MQASIAESVLRKAEGREADLRTGSGQDPLEFLPRKAAMTVLAQLSLADRTRWGISSF